MDGPQPLLKRLFAWLSAVSSLIVVIGLAMLILSTLIHNALSGELFWGLRYAPMTPERFWTFCGALCGFLLLSFGLIVGVLHDDH